MPSLNPMNLSPRIFFLLTAAACGSLLAYGYYLQFVDGLEPCPMCILQRICYIVIVLVSLAGAVHGPRLRAVYVYGSLTALTAMVGGGVAGRQVWLQHLPPDRVPECGPGLEFMLEVYPLAEVIKKAFVGTGECAQVQWTFLGLSIAEWSLVCFFSIFVAYITYMWTRAHAVGAAHSN
jgi:protein dithiol:quinone oxidoreductase